MILYPSPLVFESVIMEYLMFFSLWLCSTVEIRYCDASSTMLVQHCFGYPGSFLLPYLPVVLPVNRGIGILMGTVLN